VIALGPLVALAVIWLMGALVLSLLRVRRASGVDMLVADFAAGVVILAAAGMATLAFGGRLSVLPIYGLLALLVAAALWQRRSVRITLRVPGAPRVRVLLALVALLLLVLLVSSSQDRLVWDGWAFWTLKARILFLEGRLPAAALDPAGPYPYAHPDYPLAIPLLDWWLYRHANAAVPALACIAGTLWFATLPAGVWAALRPRAGEAVAALGALGITAFWPLAFYASGGYADVVIALALLGTILELGRARDEGDPGAPARVVVFLTLAALAKNEGLPLAAIGGTVAAVQLWRGGERRARAYAALALPFLALAPWFLLTRHLGLVPQQLANSAPAAAEVVARVPVILGALGKLLFTRSWTPLPFLVLTALAVAIRRKRFASPAGWGVVAGYGAVIGGVYLATALDVEWLLRTTLDRMVGDLVPAVVVLSVLEIWEGGDPQRGLAAVQGGEGANQESIDLRMTSASSTGML
jgi:hypothetical protein